MKNLFIRGPIRIGKSTALRSFINENYKHTIGMSAQRILTKEQQIMGYQAELINNTTIPMVDIMDREHLENVFIYKGIADECVLGNIIEKIAKLLVQNNYDLIILDEIGGFELLNPRIFSLLQEIINSPIPCVGTLKQYHYTPKTNTAMFRKPYWQEYQLLEKTITAQGQILDVQSDTLNDIPLFLQRLSKTPLA